MVRNTALAPTVAKTFDDLISTGTASVAAGVSKYSFLLRLDPGQGDPTTSTRFRLPSGCRYSPRRPTGPTTRRS